MKNIFSKVYWLPGQVATWIYFRNEKDFNSNTIPYPLKPKQHGEKIYRNPSDIESDIIDELQNGSIVCFGRLHPGNDMGEIPIIEWSELRFKSLLMSGIEPRGVRRKYKYMRDHDKIFQPIAVPENIYRTSVNWIDLTFKAEDVLKVWPSVNEYQRDTEKSWGENWSNIHILLRGNLPPKATNKTIGRAEYIDLSALPLINKKTGRERKGYAILEKMARGLFIQQGEKRNISALKKSLEEYFKIPEPFYEYVKSQGYKPRFEIEIAEDKAEKRAKYDAKHRSKEVRYNSDEELQRLIREQEEDQKDFPNHNID